jgi:hypothetical protein
MADLGQDKDSLELKIMEVEHMMRLKKNAREALLTDIDAVALNLKRIEIDKRRKEENIEEINRQLEGHLKDLESLKVALQKQNQIIK